MIIRVRDIPPYDGDYPVQREPLQAEELHELKLLSGVRPAEIEEAFEQGDAALVAGFIYLMVKRSRRFERVRPEPFMKSDLLGVVFDVSDDAEGDASPLPSGIGEQPKLSGSPSLNDSASPEPIQFPTGVPSSESSESRPSRSAG